MEAGDDPREEHNRRQEQPSDPSALPQASGRSSSPWSATLTPASPEDDAPVTSEAPGTWEEEIGAPVYGELAPPGRMRRDLEIEPLSPPATLLTAPQTGAAEPYLLDAWYATFGHPGLTARLQRPGLAEALFSVPDPHDLRVAITDTTAYPWRCVCGLIITAADGSQWLGTGWLAGPCLVVTAGHCVYLPFRGGWAVEIEVIPGWNGNARPFESAIAQSFRSVRGWVHKLSLAHDYGAIVLPVDRRYGERLGSLGFMRPSYRDLRERALNLAGYPCDKPRGTLWYQARRLEMGTERTLEYRITTVGGESGAPIWLLRNGERYVIGAQTGGDAAGSAAVRINEAMFANLSRWKRESA